MRDTEYEMGYGVCEGGIRWAADKNRRMKDLILKCESLKTAWQNFLCGRQDDGSGEEDAAFEEFSGQYENRWSRARGPMSLLCDAINGLEYGGEDVFRYEDRCLYATETLPKNKHCLAVTQEGVRETLAKYLDSLLVKPAEVAWHKIHFG